MDPNEDTVRSLADLLVRSSSIDDISLSSNPDGSFVDSDARSLRSVGRGFSRSDSIHHAKTRLTSELMRDDAEGLEVEPSVITDTVYQKYELLTGIPKCFRRELLLKVFVGLLFVCIVSSIVIIFEFYNHQKYQDMLGRRILFNEVTKVLDIEDVHRTELLRGHLGMNLPSNVFPYNCGNKDDHTELCLRWKHYAELHVQHHMEGDTNCYDVGWVTLDESLVSTPKDCFELSWGAWYGGGLLSEDLWPLNNATVPVSPFVTSSQFEKWPWGSVIDRYWLTSSGVGIHVDSESRLHVSINDNDTNGQLCLHSFHEQARFTREKPSLNYTVCVGLDPKATHQVMLDQFMKKPGSQPQYDVIAKPVWSTFGNMRNIYDQKALLGYVQEISDRSYTQSLLIIEDGWQAANGDFRFDPERFEDPSGMIQNIKDSGFNVSLWVHPYFPISADGFQEIVAHEIAVRDSGGVNPGLTHWWNGPHSGLTSTRPISGVIDLSPKGQDWFQYQLEEFRANYSLSNFCFWGGEATMLPHEAVFTGKVYDPSEYTAIYSKFAAKLDSLNIISSAYHSQAYASLVRLPSSPSTWEGLRGLIPKVLTLGILGYPYVLPDSIGGVGWPYPPSEELYMRWMQLNAFLPVMHFSKLPHDFSADVVEMARKLIELHANLVAPTITALANSSLANSFPIIRPLWWVENSETAHTIDSEFLIGDEILVTPVLVEGASMRDIYLPTGNWTDALNAEILYGPRWIRNYQVELNQIPYFLKS